MCISFTGGEAYIYTVRTILIYDIVQYSGIYCEGIMTGTICMEVRLIDSST